MSDRPIRVLVVCVGNSARSVMAEALLRRDGGDAFEVQSAGTEPKGINPLTLRVLEEAGIDASWARSKSVTEFLGQQFDYVITVCDEARQACPVFPGVHETLHWDYEDPAAAEGTEADRLAVFRRVFLSLGERIADLIPLALPNGYAVGDVTELHFLRHADAGDPTAWQDDDAKRPLSDKGEKQADRLGRFLAGIHFSPDAVISSPKVRAARTAEIVAGHLGVSVAMDDRLAGALDAESLDAVLRDAGSPSRPVVVGHDPDFSDLLAELCGATGLSMRKGALARVDIEPPLRPATGTLRWLVPPDLLKPGR